MININEYMIFHSFRYSNRIFKFTQIRNYQAIKKEPNELLFLSENLFRLTFQITLPY
jgi:hypothetical protein